MSWKQDLVNSQVDVNRAVFEMNRPGAVKGKPWHKKKYDENYILDCMRSAVKSLSNAIEELEPQKQIQFEKGGGD